MKLENVAAFSNFSSFGYTNFEIYFFTKTLQKYAKKITKEALFAFLSPQKTTEDYEVNITSDYSGDFGSFGNHFVFSRNQIKTQECLYKRTIKEDWGKIRIFVLVQQQRFK